MNGATFTLRHGSVVIAAITSCTNTSNPSVMLAAGLLARNAVAKGLTAKPWVKTSLAPGSKVVTDYFNAAGVMESLEQLGFHLVGYGCTTCIGNSGPLPEPIAQADRGRTSSSSRRCSRATATSRGASIRSRASTTSRRRRSSSRTRSPGRMDIDLDAEPFGIGSDGPVFLRDIWPSPAGRARTRSCASVKRSSSSASTRTCSRATTTGARSPFPTGDRYAWSDDVDVREESAVLRGHDDDAAGRAADRRRARARHVRRLDHHRPHLARGHHRRQRAPPGNGSSRRACRRRTSTRTARGAAITR